MWSWWRWERIAVVDIVCGVAELVQSGAQGLLQADLEPGQPAVWLPRHAAGELAGVGDRGPVLPGVEQRQDVAVLDHIRVDRPGPVQRREAWSHQKAGRQVDARWSGRICTWPVLTTGIRRIGLVASISGYFQ